MVFIVIEEVFLEEIDYRETYRNRAAKSSFVVIKPVLHLSLPNTFHYPSTFFRKAQGDGPKKSLTNYEHMLIMNLVRMG